METFCILEKLKESIKSDFRGLEERCSEFQSKIHCLEKENSAARELTYRLQQENAGLKESLRQLQKELAYKDEKLQRKSEELHRKDRWWSRYRRMSERRFKEMKDHGTFPSDILENYVNKDMNEQMNDVPDNSEFNKKHRNLSTFKNTKKVRYNRVSSTTSSLVKKGRDIHKNNEQVCQPRKRDAELVIDVDENLLFSDPNESTKLYQNSAISQDQDKKDEKASVSRELAVCPNILVLDNEDVCDSPEHQGGKVGVSDRVSVRPEVLVTDTEDVCNSPKHQDGKVCVPDQVSVRPVLVPDSEDVYSEEVDNGLHCSIGAPSAASTPLAAANSPLFGYDNDDDDNDISSGILGGVTDKSLRKENTVHLLMAAKTQLAHLPKSDSQFPVDLSYTQPQSPTIPSRTRSLQQDLNLTADCSVSLLPHGMKNEDMESKTDLKLGGIVVQDNNDTVFMSDREDEEQIHLKQGENINSQVKKATKQTTLDANLLKVKESVIEKNGSAGKRKRGNSDECDDFTWPSASKHEQPAETVFKVPVAPPHKTPEVVVLEEFPCHVTGRKSCSIPLSSSGDMDQSVDLFGNMDDQLSPDLPDEKEKNASTEISEKENVSNKNCGTKPGYKYVEVVRKKDDRAKLNGYKCRDCQEYYEGLNLPEEELKKRLKHCSRHRARFSPPPSTPPGFWNLSFPDTQEYMDKGYLKTEAQAPAPKRLRRTRRNKIAKGRD